MPRFEPFPAVLLGPARVSPEIAVTRCSQIGEHLALRRRSFIRRCDIIADSRTRPLPPHSERDSDTGSNLVVKDMVTAAKPAKSGDVLHLLGAVSFRKF